MSAVCCFSRLINLKWRFPSAAFAGSNERQVPVRVGAILLSNTKIEAFSSFAWGRDGGRSGVIAPTGGHHLLCLFTLSLVPFFGAGRSLQEFSYAFDASFDFKNMHRINKEPGLQKLRQTFTCCWSPSQKCFQSCSQTTLKREKTNSQEEQAGSRLCHQSTTTTRRLSRRVSTGIRLNKNLTTNWIKTWQITFHVSQLLTPDLSRRQWLYVVLCKIGWSL